MVTRKVSRVIRTGLDSQSLTSVGLGLNFIGDMLSRNVACIGFLALGYMITVLSTVFNGCNIGRQLEMNLPAEKRKKHGENAQHCTPPKELAALCVR